MSDLQWTAGSEDAGVRLDKFLAQGDRLGSRARALAALDRGKIFLNGTEAAAADRATLLGIGDVVRVWMDRPGSARRRSPARTGTLDILYEDDALLVLNKPAGLLVVPLERRGDAPSVYDQVEQHLRPRGKRRPLIVHRIDRDTSGLVVFAKIALAQERLKEQFKRHEAERVYRAIVYGHPRPPAGSWRDQLVWDRRALIQKETHARDPRGKEAISEYRVLETFRGASLIEVRLVTGSATRSGFRPGCAATPWSASSGTSMDRSCCAPWRSGARRSTPIASGSATRWTSGRCSSRRRCLPISSSCSRGCAAAREPWHSYA